MVGEWGVGACGIGIIRLLPDGEHARGRGEHRAIARVIAVWSAATETLAAYIDNVRLELSYAFIIEAQILRHAAAEVLRHHIAHLDQPPYEIFPFISSKVHPEAALVAVRLVETGDFILRPEGPDEVQVFARFDLDDVSPQLPQYLAGIGNNRALAKAYHHYSFKCGS